MLAHYNAADDDDDEFSRDFDPIAIGELPVDVKLVKDPREYFLWVATIRVKRVQEEWSNVVCKLRELTKEYVSVNKLITTGSHIHGEFWERWSLANLY